MNHKYLDTLWFQAQHEAIEAGELFTRYRFANLVAAAEREACAQVCESLYGKSGAVTISLMLGSLACAAAIRARGNG